MLRRLRCRLQGRDYLGILRLPVVDRLIFKDQEESARDRLPRTDRLDQVVIVLLKLATFFVRLRFHIPLDCPQMLTDVCLFRQDFHLNFDWGYLHPAAEGENDVLLLSGAAQEEVDRFNLQNFDVSPVCCFDDPVADVLYGNEIIGRLRRFFAGSAV